ncbi:MAG: CHASE3 domain-containing protein [Coxiellaceae bacterium]|nr:CHASE3 domain-containing protein [Coxiellaceae bacterium]
MKSWFSRLQFKGVAFSRLDLATKMLISSIIPLILIVFLSIVTFIAIRSLENSSDWVKHTSNVLIHAGQIEKLVIDLETGERGFLISGKESFLEPFNKGKLDIAAKLAETKRLVSDNPAQVKRIEQVEKLVDDWLDKAAMVEINARKQVNLNAKDAKYLQAVLSKGVGKGILDKIRQQLNFLEDAFNKANNAQGNLVVMAIAKDMVDQETGQRGYLITGKENFLEPYYQGQKNLNKHINEINSIVDRAYDRKQLLLDVEQLQMLSTKWNDDVAVPAKALRAEVNAGRASHQQIQAMVAAEKGKTIVDQMRKILNRMNGEFSQADNKDGQNIVLAITKNIVDMETGIRGYLLSGKDSYLQPYRSGIKGFNQQLKAVKDLVDKAYNVHKVRRQIAEVKFLANEWLLKAAQPEIAARKEINANKSSIDDVIALVEMGTGKAIFDKIRAQLDAFANAEQELMIKRESRSAKATAISKWVIIIGTIGIIILSLIFTYFIINIIARQLKKTADVANAIAAGDYDIEVELQNEKDNLGKSLQKMTAALKENTLKLTLEKAKLEDQDWIKSSQSNLISILQEKATVQDFSDTLMSELVPLLGGHLGLFYISQGEHGAEVFVLQSSYAYKKRKNISNQFALGEGLVGQCALEKKMILLTDAPDEYIEISSGSGKGKPRNIIVLPIMVNNDVIAVLEIASVHAFDEKQQVLLEIISANIGVIINNITGKAQTEALLSQAQELTSELQAQQEELRAANEELEQKSNILKESESELKAQSEELQAANEELEEKSAYLEEQKQEIENKNQSLENAKQAIELKAEELEVSGTYKSEFLANMSHELRTPLNSLLILSKSLADNDDGNLTEEQIEECGIIHAGGQELLNLINDILDLSKVEAGKMELVLEPVQVQHIATDLNSLFKPVAEKKQLEYVTEIDSEVDKEFTLDEQRVAQVLKNLLSNAFKFTKQGSVTFKAHMPATTTNFKNTKLTAGNTIAFSVIDTGVGIPDKKQAQIFEAFTQVDGSTSREYGGTGLGLTISRQLAQLMGGEIGLQSEEGKGTTFTLYLPVASGNNMNSSSGGPEIIDNDVADDDTNNDVASYIDDDRELINDATEKILLIIDDDKAFANILIKQGRKNGFSCIAAGTGKDGIALANQYTPTAILLDLGLPDIDGHKVLTTLKRSTTTRHIPVHIISAADNDHKLLETGAIGFLQKPVSDDDINDAFGNIEGILQKKIKNVLLIEDDLSSQKAICKLIQNDNIEVILSQGGDDAIDKIKHGNIDTIILDLGLKGLSGYELLNSLSEKEKVALPPVIVYTGKELSEDEYSQLRSFTSSIVIKGADSPERLMDEVSLFLHNVDSKLPKDQQHTVKNMSAVKESLEGHKVLLVDDDMRNLFALSKVLKKSGLIVEMAKNGQFALDMLAKSDDIDLVIMDIMMPVMDGYAAIEAIRKDQNLKNMPVIALTAKAMPEDRQKCIDVGANDYLAKPVDVDKLLSLIRVWIGKV